MTPPGLFRDCPVPGCRQPVTDPREPCGTCRELFGDYLARGSASTGPEAYAARLAERDKAVAAAYARRTPAGGVRGARVEAQPAVLVLLDAAQVPPRAGPSQPVDLRRLPEQSKRTTLTTPRPAA
jgi:hypothetical protein